MAKGQTPLAKIKETSEPKIEYQKERVGELEVHILSKITTEVIFDDNTTGVFYLDYTHDNKYKIWATGPEHFVENSPTETFDDVRQAVREYHQTWYAMRVLRGR